MLLGAVGGPKWDTLPANLRPEKGLLGIRAAMGLYTNLRPARLYQALREACPLKESTAEKGFDLMMVRELTGGIYFGKHETVSVRGIVAENTPIISSINGFKGLYFDLRGHLLFVRYADRPGVLARITAVLGDAEINIENITAPIDHEAGETLAVIKTNKPVTEAQVSAVATLVNALSAFSVSF